MRVGASLVLPLGFTLGNSGRRHFTIDRRQRFDRTRTFTVSVLNRTVILFRFSPQIALIHEARLTNAQAQDYDRNRAELRFVRQF